MNTPEKNRDSIIAAWRNVERISFGRVMPADRESLLEFVEGPLKTAVGILYDKNIQTFGSSCNIYDYSRGAAWISLSGETISDENLAVARAYEFVEETEIDGMNVRVIGLHFPITEDDLPGDIEERAKALAEKFCHQPFTWAEKWTMEEVKEKMNAQKDLDLPSNDDDIIRIMREDGYFYDESTRTFFVSEEQFLKYTQS